MISTRRLATVAIALALALVPTILHSYLGMTATDGRSVREVPAHLEGLQGRDTRRSTGWVSESYGTTNFIERQYGPALTLFMARSYDPKGLYHHPENGVAHGDNYERVVMLRRPDRPEVPIFTLSSHTGGYSAYALLYENTFVEHPMRFQLGNAFTLLTQPRGLMTLFFVRGKVDATSPAARSTVEGLLLAAIDSFLAQPTGTRP